MKRWPIHGAPSAAQLDEIAATLLGGGVVLLPTDTIYGLHAVASHENAVSRIRAMKGRDADKPFIVLAANVDQIAAMGIDVLPEFRQIWPAPLTVIFASGATSTAVRIPALGWLRELLERTGPLVSTSANRSGEPPITEPEKLARDLQTALDGLVDEGLRQGEPSAILDLTGSEPRFIREGEGSFTQKVWKTLRKTP
jgi:L-threonylcarbamoyladenylate synthase